MLVPKGKGYPSTMQLFKSAQHHLKVHRALNRKNKPCASSVAFTILMVLALAVNTFLTIAVAVN